MNLKLMVGCVMALYPAVCSAAIDLGRIEIEGKIRRPPTLVIEGQSESMKAISVLVIGEFEKIEQESLTPHKAVPVSRGVKK